MKAIREANSQLEADAREIRSAAGEVIRTMGASFGQLSRADYDHCLQNLETIRALAHNLSL